MCLVHNRSVLHSFHAEIKARSSKKYFTGTTGQYTVSEAFLMEGVIRDKGVVINKIA